MPTALVTGASGFTGHYMVDALQKRGFHVVKFVGTASADPDGIVCDLTDAPSVRAVVTRINPDWVVHLAALSFVAHEGQHAFYDVNVFGTINLLQALVQLENRPSRILIASSANVYGSPDIGIIDENISPAPVNHYACSKLCMEHMVATWFDHLPIIITRPFNYTGPYQHNRFIVPKIVEHFVRRSRAIELGNIDVSRDFSDVRDVVRAYVALLDSGVSSTVVNISSGVDTALLTIINKMNVLSGYEIEVKMNPEFIRKNEIRRLSGSNKRLREITGWKPEYSLDRTLKDMYEAKTRLSSSF